MSLILPSGERQRIKKTRDPREIHSHVTVAVNLLDQVIDATTIVCMIEDVRNNTFIIGGNLATAKDVLEFGRRMMERAQHIIDKQKSMT